MYRHLTSCLNADASDDLSPEERRENAQNMVHALQRRTTLVTESTMQTLQSADVTNVDDQDVREDVQVICRTCGRCMDFEDALTEGCDCA
jgi:hypothetical protein